MTVSHAETGAWRKSSHSGAGNDCVELACRGSATAVRDSKNPDGPRLTFEAGPWDEFLVRATS